MNLNKFGPALWLDAWTNGKRGEKFPGTEYQERMIQTDETSGSQRSTERAGFRRMGHVFVACKFDSSLSGRWKSVICLICARTAHLILDTRPSELIIKVNTTVSKMSNLYFAREELGPQQKSTLLIIFTPFSLTGIYMFPVICRSSATLRFNQALPDISVWVLVRPSIDFSECTHQVVCLDQRYKLA